MRPPWRVYYADGSTFEGHPEDAPKLGVQVIAQTEPDGPTVIYGKDFYIWRGPAVGERWYPADDFGLWEYLSEPGWKIVLFGRTIPTAHFRALVDRAVSEGG